MAPLEYLDINEDVLIKLKQLKNAGVEAISTDIWWNHVEYYEKNYDWRTAKLWLRTLRKLGLKWIVILSFHTCGHNVNDNFYTSLPDHIKEKFPPERRCFYDDEGNEIDEYVSFWNHEVYESYYDFIKSFYDTFCDNLDSIEKVYVSMGPAGELRFPSYNPLTGWRYPHQGKITAYSKDAILDYQSYLKTKPIVTQKLFINQRVF